MGSRFSKKKTNNFTEGICQCQFNANPLLALSSNIWNPSDSGSSHSIESVMQHCVTHPHFPLLYSTIVDVTGLTALCSEHVAKEQRLRIQQDITGYDKRLFSDQASYYFH